MDKETIMQTEAIFVHHTQSLFGGQLEDVLSDYTEDSVLFTPNGVFKGLAGMREFFGNAIKDMPPDWVKNFTMVRQDVEGETVYILWKSEPFVPLSTDTFIVHKGKIMVQTVFYGA
jgi:ketosteroid isomerase-like protein